MEQQAFLIPGGGGGKRTTLLSAPRLKCGTKNKRVGLDGVLSDTEVLVEPIYFTPSVLKPKIKNKSNEA